MGFSISWIAVAGKSKADVLAALSLVDTGEPDYPNESPVSGAELPGGWYVLFLNDFNHPYSRAPVLRALSTGASAGVRVLVCHVEEHVMASTACMFQDGAKIWDVTHDADRGLYHLAVEGEPPAALDAIHAQMKAEQDAEGGEDADVDMLFDVPIMLAASLCGYRHDQVELASGEEPPFTRLADVRA